MKSVDKHGNHMTLAEVGEVLGVTRERVRQIEAKALRKLRTNPDAIRLREQLAEEHKFTDTVNVEENRRAWERLFAAQDRSEDLLTRPLPARWKRKVG